MKSYKIKISHLSSKIDEKDLQDNFEKIGKIVEIELKHKKATIVSVFLGGFWVLTIRNMKQRRKRTGRFKNSMGLFSRERLMGKTMTVRITGSKSRSVSSENRERSYEEQRNSRRNRDYPPIDISCYYCQEKGHR